MGRGQDTSRSAAQDLAGGEWTWRSGLERAGFVVRREALRACEQLNKCHEAEQEQHLQFPYQEGLQLLLARKGRRLLPGKESGMVGPTNYSRDGPYAT